MQGKAWQGRESWESPSLSFNSLISKDLDRFDEMNSPELYLAPLFNPCFSTLNWQGRFPFRLVTKDWELWHRVTDGLTKAKTRTVRRNEHVNIAPLPKIVEEEQEQRQMTHYENTILSFPLLNGVSREHSLVIPRSPEWNYNCESCPLCLGVDLAKIFTFLWLKLIQLLS